MTRIRNTSRFLLAAAGILLALLVTLVLLAPWMVNTKAFQDQMQSELERRAGIRLSYAHADIRFFPHPHVVVRDAAVLVPGQLQGTARIVEAGAELLPLLRGRLRLGKVLLDGPEVQASIPKRQKPGEALSAEKLEEDLSSLLSTLGSTLPAAVVTIRNGRVELSDAAGPIASLREIDARVGFPPERLTLSIRSASTYWEALSVDAVLRPEGLRGTIRLEGTGFRVREFLDRIALRAVPWLGETVASLRCRVETEGFHGLTAGWEGSIPTLAVARGARTRTFRIPTFNGTFDLRGEKMRLALSDLAVDDPQIRLSGELSMDRRSPSVEARLSGRYADIPSIRAAILALAGDVEDVRDVLDVVRGGTLSPFSLNASGKSPRDLADLRSFDARATVAGGTITVPGIDLTLTDVGGEASLSGGILAGRGLSARLGKSSVREGTLRMGIAGRDQQFHVEAAAHADLGELQPLLRRLVPDEGFRREIDRIHGVRGTAFGRLILGERLSSIRPKVSISQIDFEGSHDRLPFPIAIRGGQGSYAGDRIEVTDLQASLGRSTVSGLTGWLALGKTPEISIRKGTARVASGELYPWIASQEDLRETLKPVRSMRGTVEFTTLSCDGPLGEPGEWRFEAGGSVENLEVDAPLLPGPVMIPGGRFRVGPAAASFTDLEAALLDTNFRGRGQLRGYRNGVEEVSASLQGSVGSEVANWAYARFGVPPSYAPKAPFTVTRSTLSWGKTGGAAVVDAGLAWAGGPEISFSLRKTPESLSLEPLVIRDSASDASVTLLLEPATAKIRYAGTLSRATIEKVVPIPVRPGGRLHGKLELLLDRKKPARSSAHGRLEASDLTIPWKPLSSLAIRSISLSAEGNRIRVGSSDLFWDNVPFSLAGGAEFGAETVVADLDLSAGDIDFDRLLESLKTGRRGSPEAGAAVEENAPADGAKISGGSPGFPIQGILRLRADSVSYRGFTWRPVRATADIGGGRLRFVISDATLCGISTLGTLALGSAGTEVDLSVSAAGKEVQATMACLSEKRVLLTGTYTLSVRVAGKGTGDSLMRSFRGPAELTLKDGRIHQMTILSRIFNYLSLSEVLTGQLPDLDKEGFRYRSLAIRGKVSDGKFLLEEATMDAPSMGMAATGEADLMRRQANLQVLVLPFSTLDAVVRKVPVLGYILGGTLISIPVAVRGSFDDLKVTPLAPSAVGKGLMGLVERTLKVPGRIISPILPGKSKEGEGTSPAPISPP